MEKQAKISSKNSKQTSWKRYVSYIALVLILTTLSLFFSLYGQFDSVLGAVSSANPLWISLVFGLVFLSYLLDGFVVLVFARLYTRRYYFHQACAANMVGAFYSAVTPSSSGGQVMEAYTMKKQGITISNAASIMVMWFIIYQVALIFFDVIAIIVEWDQIINISFLMQLGDWKMEITMLPLIIGGFALNLGVCALLFLMSYSHRFHNFIMHHVVGFLGKIHIKNHYLIKDPDKTRESLRVQVENFKIELKRLQANVPVTVLIFVTFLLIFFIRYSIPFFAGLALDALPNPTVRSFFDACFLSSFHQMVSGLIPTPGAAGVSELFFTNIFSDFYSATLSAAGNEIRSVSANISAAQIIWRFFTFHVVVIVSGLVSALYRSRPNENFHYANRQTFVDMQLSTFEERKVSVDTLFETRQLSRKDIQKRLANLDTFTYIGDDKSHHRTKGFTSEKDEDRFS